MLQGDFIPHGQLQVRRHGFLDGDLADFGGQRPFQHDGDVDVAEQGARLKQNPLPVHVHRHREGIAAFHGVNALPGGDFRYIVLGDAVGAGDFHGFKPSFLEVAIRPVQNRLGRGLKARINRNAHGGDDGGGDKRDARFSDAAQQMLRSILLHHHTNSFALAG